VTAEGADFLEGALGRLDDAYHRHRLRQLQLTHYRVNELGDIQTESPEGGGLTDFGAWAATTGGCSLPSSEGARAQRYRDLAHLSGR
jgi:hypothetical protein